MKLILYNENVSLNALFTKFFTCNTHTKKTLANFGLKNQLKFFDIFYAIDFNFKSTFQSKLYPTCKQEPPINSRIMEFFGMDSGLTGST